MSRIERLIRPITLSQAHKAALVLILAGVSAGCAPLTPARGGAGSAPRIATQDGADSATRIAIVDFTGCTKPEYPAPDLRAGHQGTVVLGYRIREDGKVMESKVNRSSGYPLMDEAARLAIDKCRFRPAMQDGRPVEAWTDITYIWAIS